MAARVSARPSPAKAYVPPPVDHEPDNDGDEPHPTPAPPVIYYGIYSCGMLENLWISEGGNPGAAVLAASIAKAESGGNPSAISPTADYGLWQINISHGAQASLNPVVNARAAIAISNDGTDWYPWTTYTSGAYIGLC